MFPVLSHRRCSHIARFTSLVLITTLNGCREQRSVYPSDLESSECRFERMGLARLTLSRQLGTASLTTRLSAAASGLLETAERFCTPAAPTAGRATLTSEPAC